MKKLLCLPILVAVVLSFTGCGTPTVKTTDTVVGTGDVAVPGKTVGVEYTGKLRNGITFDTNVASGKLLSFTLGKGEVIKGWDDGLLNMKVGGERDLDIPASLAYGPNSPTPLIPPNSDLLFHVKLVSVK